MRAATPARESAPVLWSHIFQLAEYLESIHQVSLLSRGGLKIVSINTNGT